MPKFSPETLYRAHMSAREGVSNATFYNRSDMGFTRVREMWVAARFGQGVQAHLAPCSIRMELIDDQSDVDFTLLFDDQTLHDFQIAEVQRPGRQRGREYAERTPGVFYEEPVLRDEEELQAIRAAIQKKVDKRYSRQGQLHLLLYLNLSAADLSLSAIREACEDLVVGFAGVWVVTGELFGCVHLADKDFDNDWRRLPPEP